MQPFQLKDLCDQKYTVLDVKATDERGDIFIAEGEARGKVLAILEVRFIKIPQEIEKAIRSMVDLIVLEPLVERAKTCKSLDEFTEALK